MRRGRRGRRAGARRIAVVVTARPSYARVKPVLEAVRDHPCLELQLVLGASALRRRYGAVVDVIRGDGFEVAATADMAVDGDGPVTAAKSTGRGIVELAGHFDRLCPDVVLTVADRFETLATAVAASYLHLPLAHLQGGEVSGSIDERVRHAVTKLSDLHFVANNAARRRVVAMGERPESVFVTGCPSVDLAARVRDAWDPKSFDPFELIGGDRTFELGNSGPQDGYLVVLQHPVTTDHRQAGSQVTEVLAAVRELACPTFWFRPNIDPGSRRAAATLRQFRDRHPRLPIRWLDNLPPEDFLRLLLGCRCLVGNSSVGVREAAFLGVPAVNVGDRQAGRDRGANLIDVGYDRRRIVDAVRDRCAARPAPDELYGDGRAGRRISELLAGVPLSVDKRLSYR